MQILLSLADFEAAKKNLATAIPSVKSSHRVEALARALGYNSNAALRADLSDSASVRTVDPEPFESYLREHGIDAAGHAVDPFMAARHNQGFDITGWLALHAVAKVAMQRAMDAESHLTLNGIAGAMGKKEEADRPGLLEDYYIRKFLLAWDFVSRCEKRATVVRRRTSYGLKHSAEAYHRRVKGDGDWHIANGCFIAALMLAGFKIRGSADLGPNVQAAISEKSVERLVRRPPSMFAIERKRKDPEADPDPIHFMGVCTTV